MSLSFASVLRKLVFHWYSDCLSCPKDALLGQVLSGLTRAENTDSTGFLWPAILASTCVWILCGQWLFFLPDGVRGWPAARVGTAGVSRADVPALRTVQALWKTLRSPHSLAFISAAVTLAFQYILPTPRCGNRSLASHTGCQSSPKGRSGAWFITVAYTQNGMQFSTHFGIHIK